MEESKTIFSAEDLTVHYGQKAVLWDISFQISEPRLIGIIGPNGAGKSTFIKAVLGVIPSASGCVRFWGKAFNQVRNKIAYIPQKEKIDWQFPITVYEVVLMGRYGKLSLLQRPRTADYDAVEHALRKVGLEEYRYRQISELSGGQQQRLFIARALVQEAELYFLDEPFQGVDLATEKTLIQILKQLKDDGKTVFMVHHDLLSLENYFDYLVMVNTRLITCGLIKDVLTEENLLRTYGKHSNLFDETTNLSLLKKQGIR